jgi:aminoglycoside phosphotransferase (APT) family kinase protein
VALSNITDPVRAASSLATALRRRMAATDVDVHDVRIPPASGMSNETLLFDATWSDAGVHYERELVARVAPAGPAVYMRYDLALEAHVLRALFANTSIPVPKVLFFEDDPPLLGAPFIVMERVAGQVPADDPPFAAAGWVLDLPPSQRRRMAEESARRLAELHAIDWRGIGLGVLGEHPEAGLEGQLDFWQRSFHWAREAAKIS